jgi:hypothetical protein
LLYAPDLDLQYSPSNRRRALQSTREAAECLGLPLIHVSHNGRALLDRFVNWERSHGGVLAAIGLALGGWLSDVVIASSYDINHLIPWGSHPDLDPLWSTERTTVRIDGAECTRTDKVKMIAGWPMALSRLKVCWQADIDANCGHCEKCIRTQCALAIAGALDRAPVFLRPLTARAILDLPGPDPADRERKAEPFWIELCESFSDDPRLADLRTAARGRLPAWHSLALATPVRDAPAIMIEAPPDAAIFLLPESAGEILTVPVRARTGDHSESSPDTRRLEITWTAPAPGRTPLPLRPPSNMAMDLIDASRAADERPIPWCLIAFASAHSARLMARLTQSWGVGIASLQRSNSIHGDHALPSTEAAMIQRFSRTRVWWGRDDYLDPFLVIEALRHGCLPLQCVPEAVHDDLVARLPEGLAHFTLAIPDHGPLHPISTEERASRLDGGLSVLCSGNLERDLARIFPLAQV